MPGKRKEFDWNLVKNIKEVEEDEYSLDPLPYIDRKKEDGFTIILPNRKWLLLDLDTTENVELCDRRLQKIIDNEEIYIHWVEEWPSNSGNIHRVIGLTNHLTDIERLFLQLYLGSDPVREYLSFRRLFHNITPHNILARPYAANITTKTYLDNHLISTGTSPVPVWTNK